MDNEDLDGLAAEYALGTLAADKRAEADALIATDPGFGGIVHQWQRRLGELNVTAPAVEPPPELGDGTRSTDTGTDEAALAQATAEAANQDKDAPAASQAAAAAEAKDGGAGDAEVPVPAAAPLLPQGAKAEAEPALDLKLELQSLAGRLRRWRLAAAACGLVAVALAALTVPRLAVPERVAPRASHPLAVRPAPPAPRLVAVLQQEPMSPAFLLSIDQAARTLTVRRVAAKAPAGRSYELWAQAGRAMPRALGRVGDAEFTQRKLPPDFAVDAMRTARYEISFEPAGGSKTGAPTGPILFTGTLVDLGTPPAPKS